MELVLSLRFSFYRLTDSPDPGMPVNNNNNNNNTEDL